MSKHHILLLDNVKIYREGLEEVDRAKVSIGIEALAQKNYENIKIKKLKGSIYELIVRNHRFLFFTIKKNIYIVRAFRKKSQKTPKQEIENAEKIYKMIKE